MKITIRKGWYFSAGYKYGWKRAGLHPFGVGIKREYLYSYPELTVVIEKKAYRLNSKEAIEAVRKYKSSETMKTGTIIGIVPRDLFKLI